MGIESLSRLRSPLASSTTADVVRSDDLRLVPDTRVHGGTEWDQQVYGDLISNSYRDDAFASHAMSASIRTYIIMLGRLPAGEAAAGVRLARITAPAGTGAGLTAGLYASASLTSTSWAQVGANFAVSIAGTGVISTPFAVAADPTVNRWLMLQLVLVGSSISTYPVWAATPVAALPALASQVGTTLVSGLSSATTVPAATLNPSTAAGWTVSAQKPWAALY